MTCLCPPVVHLDAAEPKKPVPRHTAAARRSSLKPRYLALVFILAVIVPSVFLAALSIRASGREEAFAEKQLQTALLAEVTHAAALASGEVRTAADELKAGLPASIPSDPGAALRGWKRSAALVDVPFLLSSGFALLWPSPGSGLDERERTFLEENADFLSNRASTQVYKNIALVYQAEILEKSRSVEGAGGSSGAGAGGGAAPEKRAREDEAVVRAERAGVQDGAVAGEVKSKGQLAFAAKAAAPQAVTAQDTGISGGGAPSENAPAASREGAPAPSAALARVEEQNAPVRAAEPVPAETQRREQLPSQKALDVFAQSETVRESVYEEARKKGETLGTRVVEPAPRLQNAPAESRRSQFVAEAEKLSGIAALADYGIIPRFVQDRLTFLFYARLKDGRIVGCRLDNGKFRERISGVIPATWSPARILVILDEKGAPLAAPPASAGRNWRRPFVSQEIGEALPRWEAASYLTDPSAVAARARTSGLLIGILVVILFASVSGGGALVLRSLAVETRLARSKATFVTNVSHELKTPLTSIRLFVDMLRQGRQKDPAKAGEYLARIEAETERLTRLINSVLDFSALERGTRRYQAGSADLGEVAAAVVDGERQRLEGAGFAVSMRIHGPLAVDADGEALKQVILNLLSNAEKYSPDVKEIEVEAGRDGELCALCVRDRGVGVPEKLREKIFQEFFRVDDSLTARVKGTGLGLTIARRIARDHGGDVTCGARAGGGSEFTFRLPVAGSGRVPNGGAAPAGEGTPVPRPDAGKEAG